MGHHRRRRVSRRTFLLTGLVAAGVGLAGCTSGDEPDAITPESDDEGSGADDGSREVYIPPHFHDRVVVGTGTHGDYGVGLAYSVPDYYWRVDGKRTSRVPIGDDDNLQLKATLWAAGTELVLPDLELTATVEKNGTEVATARLAPLLNQRWGFQYVANLALGQYGEYAVRLEAPAPGTRRTGAFRDRFEDGPTAEFDLEFSRTDIQGVDTIYPAGSGDPGAVQTSSGGEIPAGFQPDPGDGPGTVAASGSSDDAAISVVAVPPGEGPSEDGAYLAIVATTPYNELTLSNAGVEGHLERGGETVYEGAFAPTLDPDLGYHYGAAVERVEDGDDLRLSFPTPPQVGRYEGFETAFLGMDDLELALTG